MNEGGDDSEECGRIIMMRVGIWYVLLIVMIFMIFLHNIISNTSLFCIIHGMSPHSTLLDRGGK